jgi:hypothetical protein
LLKVTEEPLFLVKEETRDMKSSSRAMQIFHLWRKWFRDLAVSPACTNIRAPTHEQCGHSHYIAAKTIQELLLCYTFPTIKTFAEWPL